MTQCYLEDQYKDYCFAQLPTVQAEVDVSQDDFITQWTAQVATEFGLDQTVLQGLYSYDETINYDSNSNTRAMWKYTASKGISGTPSLFINGVRIEHMPTTVFGWIHELNSVYNS